MSSAVLHNLVSTARWPEEMAAQIEAAALEVPALHDALADNRWIGDPVWYALYTRKPLPRVHRASSLVGTGYRVKRTLSDAQREYAGSIETRSTIFERLLMGGELSLAVQKRLAGGAGLSESTARMLGESGWADPVYCAMAAKRVGGTVVLEWLARSGPTECSRVEAEKILGELSEGAIGRRWWLTNVFDELCERRHDLLPFICRGKVLGGLFTAGLRSRHLGSSGAATKALGVIGRGLGLSIKSGAWQSMRFFDRALAEVIANFSIDEATFDAAKALYAKYSDDDPMLYASRAALDDRDEELVEALFVTGPVESISEPAVLDALIESESVNSVYVGFALCKNPNLGNRVEAVRVWIDHYQHSGMINRGYLEAREALETNYGVADVESASGGTGSGVSDDEGDDARIAPVWLRNPAKVNGSSGVYGQPVQAVMPTRYPLQLEAMSLSYLFGPEYIAGVVDYLVVRLGDEWGAWRAFFALSEDLANSDLDSLIAAALALNF